LFDQRVHENHVIAPPIESNESHAAFSSLFLSTFHPVRQWKWVDDGMDMGFAVVCVISSSAEKSCKLDDLDFSGENIVPPSDAHMCKTRIAVE
jgi:hypothetical protein